MLYAHPLYLYIWGVKCAVKRAAIIVGRGVGGKGGAVKWLEREWGARVKSRAKGKKEGVNAHRNGEGDFFSL